MVSQVLVEKKKLKNPPLVVHHLGDRVLRQPAKRIAKVDDELRQLIRDMLQTMYSEEGVGLAAPQVAVNKQLIVIDIKLDEPDSPPLVMINPVIKKHSQDIVIDQEGCLSVPGVYMDVQRAEMIEVAYKDEQGRPQVMIATDFLARVIQHEIDHLNGVLFVDRVENKFALDQELVKKGFSPKAVKSID